MAGGSGERMHRSGGSVPKPLTILHGRTLLEHSARAVLRARILDITVSVPAAIPEIGAFVASDIAPLLAAEGGVLSVIEERVPLGNIGCAGAMAERDADVLVVYADNVTNLDLAALVRHHESSGAAMTLATHVEGVRIP